MSSLRQLSSISKLLGWGNHQKSDIYVHFNFHFATFGTVLKPDQSQSAPRGLPPLPFQVDDFLSALLDSPYSLQVAQDA